MDKNRLKSLAGLPVITEKKWSGKVETKKTPPEGLFASGSKKEVCEWLKSNHKDFADAMSSLNFYMNRAGKNLDAQRRGTLESCKADLRKMYGVKEALEPFDIQFLRKMAGMIPVPESSGITKIFVKINDETIKALQDISTFRTITVIPKKGGTIAVVSGMNADVEEAQKRWPVLAKSLVESKDDEDDDADVEGDEVDEVTEMLTKIATDAEGKTGEELVAVMRQVYDAGFEDGENSHEDENKEKVEEAARKDLAAKKAAAAEKPAEEKGGNMIASIGVAKEDDAGWVAVELAKAGITVDMEEAMGVFYFNFKNKQDEAKARNVAAKLQVELV